MADIRIDFEGNAADLLRELGKVEDAVGDVERAADGAGDEFGEMGTAAGSRAAGGIDTLKRGAIALGGVLAAAQVKDFVVDSTNMAVAAEEAGNKFDATFGPAAADLAAEMETLGDKAGIADFRLKDIVATAGNVIQGLGGTREEAAAMAEALAPLAVDVASFNGSIDQAPEALQSMTSALTGNRESLKDRWGIVVREAEVIQRALNNSFKESADDLTELEKAQATYELIVERSGNAVGDLDRNLDSTSTTQARFNAALEEFQVVLGDELLPILNDALPAITGFVEGLGDGANKLGITISEINRQIMGLPGLTDRAGASIETVNQALRLLDESKTVPRQVGEAMAFLASRNEVTAEAVDALEGSLGASAGQMRIGAELALQYAMDNGFAAETVGDLALQVGLYKQAEQEAAEQNARTRGEQHLLKEAIEGTTGATEDAIEAELTLAEIRDGQISALGQVKRAQENVTEAREALINLEADPGATESQVAEAAWNLVDAESALALVMEEFADSQGPMYTDALIDIGREAGLAGDALWAFVDAALAAQGIGTPSSGGNDISVGGVGVIGPIPQQHGGVHRARRGRGNIVQVAEAGSDEAIIPLNSQGVGAIADAFSQALGGGGMGGGGGPTFVINVQGFVGSEMALAAEIDRILTRLKRSSGLQLL